MPDSASATATSRELADADWPTFGWQVDVRPALAQAMAASRPVALATLYRVEGSAPRGPGAQMLFDGGRATGYFSGDCIEGDVAGHAAEVLASGEPRHLHYGLGSPWIDIRLRCGGALYVFVERVAPDSAAARELISKGDARQVCTWHSDGDKQRVTGDAGPQLAFEAEPFHFARRFDPRPRVVVSGGDPGALAVAGMAMQAGFETVLVRPGGPESPPPFPVTRYLRGEPAQALGQIGIDGWTAYAGATHEDHHDLGGCLAALRGNAAWVGMIGARSRREGRLAALRAAGASEEELARLHLTPGNPALGKAPFEVATGILADIMQAFARLGTGA
jgi:xanthine dehydrogenase accessory factor